MATPTNTVPSHQRPTDFKTSGQSGDGNAPDAQGGATSDSSDSSTSGSSTATSSDNSTSTNTAV
ncbi:hypothetical protein [Pseudolactococcus insecticola]|nr:hypothetical protein [Lactococcus insecticola]